MKKLSFLVIVLILSLAACTASPPSSATPGHSDRSEESLPPSSEVSVLPSDSPSPSPSFAPDTLPDDLKLSDDSSSIVTDSNDYFDSFLCEDDKNIYYSWCDEDTDYGNSVLFCVNKQNGGVKVISKDCGCFALYEGKVYYTVPYKSEEYCNTIKCYDPAAGKVKDILKLKYGIYGLAGYNGKLYFTYETVHDEGLDVPLSDLYSINPDGSGKKKIQENVDQFCFYKNTIYYTKISSPDTGPLYKCKLDGSGPKELYDDDHSPYIIGKEIFTSGGKNASALDITSGKTTLLPYSAEELYDCTLIGKYLLYLTEDDQNFPSVMAYDTVLNKTYALLKLENGFECDFYTSPYGSYLVWTDDNDNINIERINISDGRASLEKTAVFSAH